MAGRRRQSLLQLSQIVLPVRQHCELQTTLTCGSAICRARRAQEEERSPSPCSSSSRFSSVPSGEAAYSQGAPESSGGSTAGVGAGLMAASGSQPSMVASAAGISWASSCCTCGLPGSAAAACCAATSAAGRRPRPCSAAALR